MKKVTTIITALALFFSASAFSPVPNGEDEFASLFNNSNAKSVKAENLSKNVSNAFNEKYAKAENVNWNQNESLYFAKFDLNNKSFTVAYSEDGELVAISRIIPLDQTPLVVSEKLNEQYPDYNLPPNVSEIVMQGSTSYYLIAEGKKHNLQLKCNPDGSISVDKKIKKKVLVGSVL